MAANLNSKVVADFGREWDKYNHSKLDPILQEAFSQYFSLLPDKYLNVHSRGFDAGCGSGRWARYIAPRVKHLHCFDPSEKALDVAKRNLSKFDNCTFECSSINSSLIKEGSMDFGYCLGVLHHLPDTQSAMQSCVDKLKKGAPLLIYIYYKFDNKPLWFRLIWKCTDFARRFICILPFSMKLLITKLIAYVVYLPLAKISLILESMGIDVSNIPLSDYRHKPFYLMSNDSLDRFGTRLEKRFTKLEIKSMMKVCGLSSISFSPSTPFWVAIGYKD